MESMGPGTFSILDGCHDADRRGAYMRLPLLTIVPALLKLLTNPPDRRD
jgi:hypothetical protein